MAYAEKSREALFAQNPTSPFSYSHFTSDWALFPVVDPPSFGVESSIISPEGQAFVVQMYQAWKDWQTESKESGSMGGVPSEGVSTGIVPTGIVSTGIVSTGVVSTGGVPTGVSGYVSTGVVSTESGPKESDTPCDTINGGVSGEHCAALLGTTSVNGDRSTALIGGKSFILVVSTILGICAFV